MRHSLHCPEDRRRAQVRAHETLNGIDYLEVLDQVVLPDGVRQQTLLAHCFRPVAGLDAGNVRVEGGERVRDVRVVWAHSADALPGILLTPAETAYVGALIDPENVLVIRTDRRGDFSAYTLRLILSPTQPGEPAAGFDALLSQVAFSFKVDCESEFDCPREPDCPEPPVATPQIDYLAKDYASFRRLLLDRLAVLMPDWTERNPADLGIAVVELLAYAGDQLSYRQDAVATEAYLGTARLRRSVRRHARLVDYFMHEGASARAWVAVDVAPGGGADGHVVPARSRVLGKDANAGVTLPEDGLADALQERPVAFETLHPLRLNAHRSEIAFYTWGDPRCCLPKGAVSATLEGSAADLDLQAGDVLIFEEVLGPESRLPEDADPAHRHVVRLDRDPVERTDPLTGRQVLQVRWHPEDALPFPLCLWEFAGEEGETLRASVARGNVVLADHGLTHAAEPLLPGIVPDRGRYRPRLSRAGLTFAAPYDDVLARRRPAAEALRVKPHRALPAVRLEGDGDVWLPQRDLLNSGPFATEFTVEMESDGAAHLRFGDNVHGRKPAARSELAASYRVGGGEAGNVGAEALATLVTDVSGVLRVRNPLPAAGGAEPEPLEQARLYAPQAFRTQERAVTEDDYAEVAARHPEVQRAAATRRWTGSWHTIFLTVDRKRGLPVTPAFREELRAFLERFRLAGYDLQIQPPRFIPLEIVFTVCVAPDEYRADVKQALLDAFSNRDLPDGRRGFFHPDNFTFGEPVYLSQLIALAMDVPGVNWVDTEDAPEKPNRFRRWGRDPDGEWAAGRLELDRLEIARLDNDPNAPENGRLDFLMLGGQ